MGLRGDFLVVGSGIAGLRAAIALAEHGSVVVLTKAAPTESNTGYAQGGIAAALAPDDSVELHVRDTLAAGDGLSRDAAVRVLVEDGCRYVRELVEWGARFDREPDGGLAFGREAAHSVRRVLHARDATGRELARLLWAKVAAHPGVTVLADAVALELILTDGCCQGVRFADRAGQVRSVRAASTLMATGGAGQVYRETTNPVVASGDGLAMAAEAGARVADLEFIQFHPTVLSLPGHPRFLLSEALRGEGAHLLNAHGERFVFREHEAGELAPRDVVARAIAREQRRTGSAVVLSLAHLDPSFVRDRFPTLAATCAQAGLDLATDPIPVSPAAHYMMGGIETDLDGRTSIEQLFAAGEAACTGVHGANRLASNSLLEGLVFGARAARAMAGVWVNPSWESRANEMREADAPAAAASPVPDESSVRTLMWTHAGLSRTRDELVTASRLLTGWRGAIRRGAAGADLPAHRRLASLVTVGALIVRASLRREESRGGHYRADFPSRDDIHWRVHLADRLDPADRPLFRITGP